MSRSLPAASSNFDFDTTTTTLSPTSSVFSFQPSARSWFTESVSIAQTVGAPLPFGTSTKNSLCGLIQRTRDRTLDSYRAAVCGTIVDEVHRVRVMSARMSRHTNRDARRCEQHERGFLHHSSLHLRAPHCDFSCAAFCCMRRSQLGSHLSWLSCVPGSDQIHSWRFSRKGFV